MDLISKIDQLMDLSNKDLTVTLRQTHLPLEQVQAAAIAYGATLHKPDVMVPHYFTNFKRNGIEVTLCTAPYIVTQTFKLQE